MLYIIRIPSDIPSYMSSYTPEQVCQVSQEQAVSLYSSRLLLLDAQDFHVITAMDSDVKIYPASLTKLMTVILAIEALDDFDVAVEISEEMIKDLQNRNASVAGFLPGEWVSVRDLLYAALLPSGADGAVALASYISGSEAAFVEKMNEKAAALGMVDTHFENATGLHSQNHVTTLEDMGLLLEYALNNPVFRCIFTTPVHKTAPTAFHAEGMYLKSTLFEKLYLAGDGVDAHGVMGQGDRILGGKTGYTPEAGLCLATLAQVGGREYVLLSAGACGDVTTLPYHMMDAVAVYESLQR